MGGGAKYTPKWAAGSRISKKGLEIQEKARRTRFKTIAQEASRDAAENFIKKEVPFEKPALAEVEVHAEDTEALERNLLLAVSAFSNGQNKAREIADPEQRRQALAVNFCKRWKMKAGASKTVETLKQADESPSETEEDRQIRQPQRPKDIEIPPSSPRSHGDRRARTCYARDRQASGSFMLTGMLEQDIPNLDDIFCAQQDLSRMDLPRPLIVSDLPRVTPRRKAPPARAWESHFEFFEQRNPNEQRTESPQNWRSGCRKRVKSLQVALPLDLRSQYGSRPESVALSDFRSHYGSRPESVALWRPESVDLRRPGSVAA